MELYYGPAFRTESSDGPDAQASAADVIRFEKTELANDLDIADDILSKLGDHSAECIVWVVRTRAQVHKYIGDPDYLATLDTNAINAMVDDWTAAVQGAEILIYLDDDGVLLLRPHAQI